MGNTAAGHTQPGGGARGCDSLPATIATTGSWGGAATGSTSDTSMASGIGSGFFFGSGGRRGACALRPRAGYGYGVTRIKCDRGMEDAGSLVRWTDGEIGDAQRA